MLDETHLSGKVQNHIIVDLFNLFESCGVVKTTDIIITHTKGALRFKAVLDAASCDNGSCYYHVIFDIGQWIGRKNTDTAAVHEAVFITVLVDRFHISAENVVEEGKLLARITVNGRVLVICDQMDIFLKETMFKNVHRGQHIDADSIYRDLVKSYEIVLDIEKGSLDRNANMIEANKRAAEICNWLKMN